VPSPSPSSNVEIVKAVYAAFNRGDVAAVVAHLDPRIRWTLSDALPFGGTYEGKEAVLGFFQKLPAWFQELRVEGIEYVASGDTVVALGRHRGKGKGGTFDVPWAMLWRFQGGKVVRFDEYQDSAKTLKAIGA
jgi:ketosteroid isomerase-like protein